jgi:pyruvate/2-oxoglutarate dehydrogenase complex dihydrolipoamide acyltransferase (E2) component
MSSNSSRILTFPPSRQFTFDIGKLGAQKHYVRGLVEVDITEALHKIKESRGSGNKVTLASWLAKVTALTVLDHPPLNGVRLRGNRIMVYDDVDVSLTIEKEINGTAVPLPVVVRSANLKSAAEINTEIQAARDQLVKEQGNYVLGQSSEPFWLRSAAAVPQWIRLIFWKQYILGKRMKSIMGTVMITAVGMVSSLDGWIIPSGIHPLLIAVGSLNKKPELIDGQWQKRDKLHLTIAVDHDIIDGIPAMRFCDDLVRRMEKAEGL